MKKIIPLLLTLLFCFCLTGCKGAKVPDAAFYVNINKNTQLYYGMPFTELEQALSKFNFPKDSSGERFIEFDGGSCIIRDEKLVCVMLKCEEFSGIATIQGVKSSDSVSELEKKLGITYDSNKGLLDYYYTYSDNQIEFVSDQLSEIDQRSTNPSAYYGLSVMMHDNKPNTIIVGDIRALLKMY